FDGWRDYDDYATTLIKTKCIDNPKKIWWDVRPHPFFPTLEYRICDIPMRVEETICFAALFQAITKKLYNLYSKNMGWRIYRRSRNAVYHAREIVKNKTGADRQVAKYEERKDLRDVVDYIIAETEHGIPY